MEKVDVDRSFYCSQNPIGRPRAITDAASRSSRIHPASSTAGQSIRCVIPAKRGLAIGDSAKIEYQSGPRFYDNVI